MITTIADCSAHNNISGDRPHTRTQNTPIKWNAIACGNNKSNEHIPRACQMAEIMFHKRNIDINANGVIAYVTADDRLPRPPLYGFAKTLSLIFGIRK